MARLLGLPAELRLRIYELALGGNTIHNGWYLRVCEASQSGSLLCPPFARPCYSHKPYRTPVFNIFSNLFLVCRQIYIEACFVPLYANTFLFDGPLGMNSFFTRLTPLQRARVSHVIVRRARGSRSWNNRESMERSRGTLPGLKSLVLCLEMGEIDLSRDFPELCLAAPGALEAVFSGVEVLKGPRLKEVEVKVFDLTTRYRRSDVVELDEERVAAWKEDLKQRLLSPT